MAIKTLDGTAVIAGLIGIAGLAGAIETGSGMKESIWLIVVAVLAYKLARYFERQMNMGGETYETQDGKETN